jgi:hypothetical protein
MFRSESNIGIKKDSPPQVGGQTNRPGSAAQEGIQLVVDVVWIDCALSGKSEMTSLIVHADKIDMIPRGTKR